jgi:CRISPR system Cascade subunit CasB
MTAYAPKKHALVHALERLARDDDRAELARLRASWRPGRELEALAFVLPFVAPARDDLGAPTVEAGSRQWQVRREDDALLLAGLFAIHPESGPLSLAKALRRVWQDTGSDSIEGRFRALLSADRTELGTHLRNAVSLAASKTLAIDWDDLYRVIKYWDGDDPRWSVRRRWAREFWAGAPDVNAASVEGPAEHAGSEP